MAEAVKMRESASVDEKARTDPELRRELENQALEESEENVQNFMKILRTTGYDIPEDAKPLLKELGVTDISPDLSDAQATTRL
jgi:hypothetical protein